MTETAPDLTKKEHEAARQLASSLLANRIEASKYMAGYSIQAESVAALLAKLKASTERGYNFAYRNAMKGIEELAKRSPNDWMDLNKLANKAAELDDWASEFKADLFELSMDNLRQATTQEENIGGPNLVYIGEIGRTLSALVASDPSNVIGHLREKSPENVGELFSVLLKHHQNPGGAEQISKTLVELAKSTANAAVQNDLPEFERHSENTGFFLGELERAYRRWTDDIEKQIENGKKIVDFLALGLVPLGGLFKGLGPVAVEVSEELIGVVYQESVEKFSKLEQRASESTTRDIIDAIGGMWRKTLLNSIGPTKGEKLKSVLIEAIEDGWGESAAREFTQRFESDLENLREENEPESSLPAPKFAPLSPEENASPPTPIEGKALPSSEIDRPDSEQLERGAAEMYRQEGESRGENIGMEPLLPGTILVQPISEQEIPQPSTTTEEDLQPPSVVHEESSYPGSEESPLAPGELDDLSCNPAEVGANELQREQEIQLQQIEQAEQMRQSVHEADECGPDAPG